MSRSRTEEPNEPQYNESDVVWVKIHNTEIWWPGEVTLSQNIRFVKSSRPPFAVVAFFNEKTYEQVKSNKLIYPFECSKKEEFIQRGIRKAEAISTEMRVKFNDDVAIAESRNHHQRLSAHAASRPDSLIKALLSSSSNSQSSSTRSSNGPSSTPKQESTFRIMDIARAADPVPERFTEASYECTMCRFRTSSMNVLLIHRRGHLESSSKYSTSSNSSQNASITSLSHSPNSRTRAARRANTANEFDSPPLFGRRSQDSSNHFRCHSRHVSIVVDAALGDEAQQRVASIAQITMESIERVVQPKAHSNSNSRASSPQVVSPRQSRQNRRDPRNQRLNRLRATMPAPEQPLAKQRRLTRSMTRRQQGFSLTEERSPSPSLPPPQMIPRRSGGRGIAAERRRTLAATMAEQALGVPKRSSEEGKTLMTKTVPVQVPDTISLECSAPKAKRRKRAVSKIKSAKSSLLVREEKRSDNVAISSESTYDLLQYAASLPATAVLAEDSASPLPITPTSAASQKPKVNYLLSQTPTAASLELQLSLMAEWGDDECEEPLDGSIDPKKTIEKAQNREKEPEKNRGVASKKRIRNIPKKDRRDVVLQEFDVDSKLETGDEPIVIQDSDASSNESVVFVEDEVPARERSNGNSKSKAHNSSSCFDFEEEEDLQQQDGKNRLSYRRRTNRNDANGKGAVDIEEWLLSPVLSREVVKCQQPGQASTARTRSKVNACNDELFKGFHDELQLAAAAAASFEANRSLKPIDNQENLHQYADSELDETELEADQLSLPIKERQKRIFKSRNKSIEIVPKDESPPTSVSTLPSDEEEVAEGGASPQLINGGYSRSSSNSRCSNSSSGRSSKIRHGSKPRTDLSRRQHRRSKLKARFKLKPKPTAEEFNICSSNSNNLSNSSSISNTSRMASPLLSSSTSCSIASNIAVISAEEARELQRTASGAGLINAAIVDATQPVQRGGVLILEDIRLPNLYDRLPFGSLHSSDSNDSRHQKSNHEKVAVEEELSRDTDEQDSEDEEQIVPHEVKSKLAANHISKKMLDEVHGEELQKRCPEQEIESGRDLEAGTEHRDLESGPEQEQELDSEPGQELGSEQDTKLVASTKPDTPEAVSFVPQKRELLLKKREQELLRQYEADLVSGRSVEKCRRARERWSQVLQSTGESSLDTDGVLQLKSVSLDIEIRTPDEDEAGQPEKGPPPTDMEAENSEESVSSLLEPQPQLASAELVVTPPYSLLARRPVSYSLVNSSTAAPTFKSGDLSYAQIFCDEDVAKAHQQLEDLRDQQRRRSSSLPMPLLQFGQRRQRRRSRNVGSDNVVSGTRHDTVETSCDPKEQHESLDNPPQLCAGRICAVMTRPIPGYNHTFMLCSLANNNFMPLNNVALYLDSEKNHLVPVPREALVEPPRLADGHPMSAVFADIDFRGGQAMAQVVEPADMEMEMGVDFEQNSEEQFDAPEQPISVESSVQVVNSHSEETTIDNKQVEMLGIMTPLSQVAEGVLPVPSFGGTLNVDEELSLHEDQLQSNVLQLNVNGHRLELDPSVLFSIAEQPDSCIELNVTETGASGVRAVLHARDILQAAQAYLQERDLQLVNVEDMTLDEEDVGGTSAITVPATDMLAEALADSQVVNDIEYVNAANASVALLNIETRSSASAGLIDVVDDEPDGVVFVSHVLPPAAAHLTPPITARTNETNALLNQTPIMSTLENPSAVQLRCVSPLGEVNLEDSLAVIGVTNTSGVPTSLELPITVTNPAIAPRVTVPIAEILGFAPFQ
ncbi:uncharacterized protein LOC111072158 [Drosophila obscura]|uniref:uncharacterized protein LOC111072158 n=1 Tax=Drosophila obscura TaxID=7282 RepID=UPI001BB1C322|nr:uncharacterized protein LOC111072158 [Drosophila obscura]